MLVQSLPGARERAHLQRLIHLTLPGEIYTSWVIVFRVLHVNWMFPRRFIVLEPGFVDVRFGKPPSVDPC